jgi:hypothetical protein
VKSFLITGAHAAAGAIGFLAIDRLARAPRAERFFWPAVAAASVAMAAALFFVTEPDAAFEDFRRAYWEAGAAVWGARGSFGSVYARGTDGFVNLPIVAYLFAPFGLMRAADAALVFFALGIAALTASWRLLVRLFGLDRRASALCLFAIACFGPAAYSLREGNISHFILALLLAALLADRSGGSVRAGVLFGVAAVLKPPLALIGVYYALRGRWGVVAGGAGAIAACALASLGAFGWDLHMLWYRNAIAPFAAGPVPGFNVQSMPAFVLRFQMGLKSFLDWDAHALSPGGRVAAALAGACVVAASVAACLKRGWRTPPSFQERLVEVMIVLTIACVASTLSWSHYYVWLMPGFVIGYLATRSGAPAAPWRPALLASYALSAPAVFFSWQIRAGAYGPFANLLSSHLLIGGLILLAVLLRVRLATPLAAGTAGLADDAAPGEAR